MALLTNNHLNAFLRNVVLWSTCFTRSRFWAPLKKLNRSWSLHLPGIAQTFKVISPSIFHFCTRFGRNRCSWSSAWVT